MAPLAPDFSRSCANTSSAPLRYERGRLRRPGCAGYRRGGWHGPGRAAIVDNASISGLVGFATLAPYFAAKHGVLSLTKCAALEYARQGIRVNAICPGYMDTSMTQQSTTAAMREALADSAPIGRLGGPSEAAEVATCLCSSAASYVNGACIPMDGGVTAA